MGLITKPLFLMVYYGIDARFKFRLLGDHFYSKERDVATSEPQALMVIESTNLDPVQRMTSVSVFSASGRRLLSGGIQITSLCYMANLGTPLPSAAEMFLALESQPAIQEERYQQFINMEPDPIASHQQPIAGVDYTFTAVS